MTIPSEPNISEQEMSVLHMKLNNGIATGRCPELVQIVGRTAVGRQAVIDTAIDLLCDHPGKTAAGKGIYTAYVSALDCHEESHAIEQRLCIHLRKLESKKQAEKKKSFAGEKKKTAAKAKEPRDEGADLYAEAVELVTDRKRLPRKLLVLVIRDADHMLANDNK